MVRHGAEEPQSLLRILYGKFGYYRLSVEYNIREGLATVPAQRKSYYLPSLQIERLSR